MMGRKNQQVWFTVAIDKSMSDAIAAALDDLNRQPGQMVKISRNSLIKNLLLQFLSGYKEVKEASINQNIKEKEGE